MASARSRLESQGYVGVGEQTLRDIQFGLRLPTSTVVRTAAGSE
jgi:hypothetical protein